jgi:hypothetical protein
MQQVPLDRLKAWQTIGNGCRIPSSIDCICGFCNTLANLQIQFVNTDGIETVLMTGRCTRCDEKSKVFLIGVITKPLGHDSRNESECWVHPKSEIRKHKFQNEEIDSPRIARAYKDAVDLFNDGRASPSITCCGRVVEGIAKINFPNASSTNQIGALFKKLEQESAKLPEEFKNLLSPLLSLGKALRIGRNTGGHFDFRIEPDRELASKILDLTEFLIEYVCILQLEADKVQELIDALEPLESE